MDTFNSNDVGFLVGFSINVSRWSLSHICHRLCWIVICKYSWLLTIELDLSITSCNSTNRSTQVGCSLCSNIVGTTNKTKHKLMQQQLYCISHRIKNNTIITSQNTNMTIITSQNVNITIHDSQCAKTKVLVLK